MREVPVVAVLLAGLVAGMASTVMPVHAQTPPPGKPIAPPEVMEPPDEHSTPPPDPSTGGDKPKEPLSEQLKEGEGVLEPPRTLDPGLHKPVPDDFKGRTPVIPPPDSGVVPK